MESFASRPKQERAEIIEETLARRGIGRAAIVEKDFWVCWTFHQLRDLFGRAAASRPEGAIQPTSGLLFKGGTSLSKVYGVIERFSEDIDLTIDRETLGFTAEFESDFSRLSNKKRERALADLASAAEAFVQDLVRPLLQTRVAELRADDGPAHDDVGVNPDPGDLQSLRFAYPRSLQTTAYSSAQYVLAEVRLEFGARGELWPAHLAQVRPYVADEFPELFRAPAAMVNVLDLSRTLWEKATILHQIAHMGVASSRDRVSRHYYDLSRLVKTDAGKKALLQYDLLERVADYKAMFWPQKSARYDLARAGTLRLVPDDPTQRLLRADFISMQEMFFGSPPSFEEVMATLESTEREINSPRD